MITHSQRKTIGVFSFDIVEIKVADTASGGGGGGGVVRLIGRSLPLGFCGDEDDDDGEDQDRIPVEIQNVGWDSNEWEVSIHVIVFSHEGKNNDIYMFVHEGILKLLLQESHAHACK